MFLVEHNFELEKLKKQNSKLSEIASTSKSQEDSLERTRSGEISKLLKQIKAADERLQESIAKSLHESMKASLNERINQLQVANEEANRYFNEEQTRHCKDVSNLMDQLKTSDETNTSTENCISLITLSELMNENLRHKEQLSRQQISLNAMEQSTWDLQLQVQELNRKEETLLADKGVITDKLATKTQELESLQAKYSKLEKEYQELVNVTTRRIHDQTVEHENILAE